MAFRVHKNAAPLKLMGTAIVAVCAGPFRVHKNAAPLKVKVEGGRMN